MKDPTQKVRDEWLKKLDDLEKSLENPNRGTDGLMKRWGAILVETSQRSFLEQKLGEWQWPARYEGMEPPFLNIAGTLQDFNAGRKKPKPNRFQDRPALVDQGMAGGLWGSITFQSDKDSASVGSNKPYSKLHQDGGVSEIPVSQEGYRLGYNWLFSDRVGTVRKGREGYVEKLWPSLARRFLRQNIVQRPFIGVTDEAAKNLVQATEEYFGERLGGGGRMVAAI